MVWAFKQKSFDILNGTTGDLTEIINSLGPFKIIDRRSGLYHIEVRDPKDDHPTNLHDPEPPYRSLTYAEAQDTYGPKKAKSSILPVAAITGRVYCRLEFVNTQYLELNPYHSILEQQVESLLQGT